MNFVPVGSKQFLEWELDHECPGQERHFFSRVLVMFQAEGILVWATLTISMRCALAISLRFFEFTLLSYFSWACAVEFKLV